MKKRINFSIIIVAAVLISWGFKGHRVIATIAQNT
jgi:hypothetical protein